MRVVRYDDIEPDKRSDGREIYSLINYKLIEGEGKFFRVKIPKGCIEKEHYHKGSEEIFIFLTPGSIIINQEEYDFKEGDIVVLEKNDRHKIVAKEEMEIIGLKVPDIDDKVVV
ncbi:MAG: cupin domain-containing protein [Nanoarchaeota archaeon]|nr:cupin domain-containing protein [Nanoarchaeota archaeon]